MALRVLIDRNRQPGRFLILGSASPNLLKQSSESLAGRLEIVELSGLSLAEVKHQSLNQHWLRGGFPPSFLADSDSDSFAWRKNFLRAFLEGDLPQFGVRVPAATVLRFWTMLAHYHGQLRNASELARSLGVNESTARRYADLLEDLFMVRQLQPWHANVKKRQVKAPKVFIRDSGLLHSLLGIKTMKDLLESPKCGASWEGYAMEELMKVLPVDEQYFWATHNGAELDLLLISAGTKYGVEFKRADAPKVTPSMRTALTDLELQKITVIYPGERFYKLAENIQVMPLPVIGTDEVMKVLS
jgi:predicted AAA+ superfamily ATPase